MPGDFFDTNVLLYLVSSDAAKAERAENLVRSGGTISVQVLNEIANVARRKMRLSWQETHEFLFAITKLLRVEPLTVAVHEAGLRLAQRYALSVYDAMITASAFAAGCDRLWSEDLQDGLVMDAALTVANPFRAIV